MPRKIYRRKRAIAKRKPKTYRKSYPKKRYHGPTVQRVRQIAGFSDKTMVKLPYDSFFTMNSALAYANFKINSIFDPFNTSSGCTLGPENVQPQGRDTYAQIYSKYRVSGCKVELWFQNYASVTNIPSRLIVYATDSSGLPNTATRGVMPHSWASLLPPTSATKATYLKRYFSAAQISGKTKSQVQGSDQFLATVGADPSDLSYLNICAATLDDSSNQAVGVRIRLTFYVSFEDPIFDITND